MRQSCHSSSEQQVIQFVHSQYKLSAQCTTPLCSQKLIQNMAWPEHVLQGSQLDVVSILLLIYTANGLNLRFSQTTWRPTCRCLQHLPVLSAIHALLPRCKALQLDAALEPHLAFSNGADAALECTTTVADANVAAGVAAAGCTRQQQTGKVIREAVAGSVGGLR